MSDLAKEPADGSVGGVKEHAAKDTLADARRIVAATTKKLASMHKNQVHRDPWPDFEAFDVARYPAALRRAAAWQWISRAQAEHGSVHQFSAVTHALTEARAPMELLGALARLITDEVRHVEVCARIALTMYPEGNDTFFQWRTPRAPWADAPRIDPNDREASELRLRGWATRAILTACALGETLSEPMLEALVVVSTDPLPRACSEQILKDERFHGRFGFEALAVLVPTLDEAEKSALQEQLGRALAGFERTTCGKTRVEDLVGHEVEIAPSTDPEGHPNLGTLSEREFAAIFYATLEQRIFPELEAVGLDPMRAWAERGRFPAPASKQRPEASAETRAAE
jgi:hypothetical protein